MFDEGFPNSMKGELSQVTGLIPFKTYNNVSCGTSEESVQFLRKGSVYTFPYRMYYVDIQDDIVNRLNKFQKMILHCIYSRSCNGYVRQKHIQSLLLMDYADWTIPYIVKPCDEYIVEILEMTYQLLKDQDTSLIKEFCLENAHAFCRSYARMISYWNEFYRDRWFNFHDYIGRRLFKECFGYNRSLEHKRSSS